MCTVTAERFSAGWRVTMNRDERRDRPGGEPPTLWPSPKILSPRDAEAGGTWIGVREDGYWACLLNGYPEQTLIPLEAPSTRGRIIPHVLGAGNPTEAIVHMDFSNTHAFRLLLGQGDQLSEWVWDQISLVEQPYADEVASFASSSYWRQNEVAAYRRTAFEDWVAQGRPVNRQGLPAFHCETLERGPEWSVFSARDLSHTKSITQIETGDARMVMRHWFASEIDAKPAIVVSMQVV